MSSKDQDTLSIEKKIFELEISADSADLFRRLIDRLELEPGELLERLILDEAGAVLSPPGETP